MDRKSIREKLDSIDGCKKQDTLEDIIFLVENCGQAGCFDEIYELLKEYKLIEE